MTTSSTSNSSVVPSEVGWQFVPQYYGFVNKEPHRLHCFYSKTSTFIHGTEGEETKPCHGQQEIHKKITSIGFENCKVFIHPVDTQASANGGIIIQVIGEMSNHSDPWRKFVQTFFLAEQPNGYFVLNDIFRFLKEETVESDDVVSESGEPAEAPVEPTPAPPAPPVPVVAEPAPPVVAAPAPVEPEPVYEEPREPTPAPPPAPVEEPAPVAAVEEEPETPEIPEPEPEPTQTPTPAPEIEAPTPAPAHPNGHAPEPDKPVIAPTEQLQEKPAPSPKPVTPAPPVVPAAIPLQSAHSQQNAPSQPRSWASLAATNQKKWGAVAQDSKGHVQTVSTPASGSQTPTTSQAPAPVSQPSQPRPPQQPKTDHPAYIAAQSVGHPQVFVKGVIEPVSTALLSQFLTTRFGPVKDVEIVRQKACSFLEFTTLDAARRAIIASLPQGQGGEGGLWIDVGNGSQIRITVETKKEKGDRPPSKPHRGGAPQQMNGGHGAPQGGYRGRGGGRGGRGGHPQK